jgi:DedD protein
MRHGSERTMNDRSLRDVERWKDKIEVRLDNRQVFFLFFGSALVACLLFILGVIVGKRLESRGKAVAPEIEDPLALLDRIATSPLAATEAPVRPAAPTPVRTVSVPLPRVTEALRTLAADRPGKVPPSGPPAVRERPPEAPPGEHPAATTVAMLEPTTAGEPGPGAAGPARKATPPSAPVPSPGETPRGKGRFTLQLGSFPDRAEAEAFARQFGPQPYVLPSEIPGRGTWYRVRVGDYPSLKDAVAAKASFEKQHSVIAYVAGPTPPPVKTSAPR